MVFVNALDNISESCMNGFRVSLECSCTLDITGTSYKVLMHIFACLRKRTSLFKKRFSVQKIPIITMADLSPEAYQALLLYKVNDLNLLILLFIELKTKKLFRLSCSSD